MADGPREHDETGFRPAPPPQSPGTPVLMAGALLAAGVAAVSLVAGLGTYLYIRFTQHRRKPPE